MTGSPSLTRESSWFLLRAPPQPLHIRIKKTSLLVGGAPPLLHAASDISLLLLPGRRCPSPSSCLLSRPPSHSPEYPLMGAPSLFQRVTLKTPHFLSPRPKINMPEVSRSKPLKGNCALLPKGVYPYPGWPLRPFLKGGGGLNGPPLGF